MSTTKPLDTKRLADDLLIGCPAAGETGLTEQQVYYGHRTGKLPLKKHGALLIGSKKRLREHFTGEAT